MASHRDQRPSIERASVSIAASPSAERRPPAGDATRSVHDSKTVTHPSPALSQAKTTWPPRRRENSTSTRCPRSGWNGWVMTTKPKDHWKTRHYALRGHPQQTLAAPGLGDHHPADRRRPVRARVQGLADRRPVFAQPRDKLLRGHAVHTGRAAVGPDTPQRPAQILRREHLLPHAHLQAGDDSILGVRRPAATLRHGAQRDLPPAPQRARVSGMAAINATSTSNTDSSVSLDVRPFPAHPDPGRYYDLC